MRNIWDLKIDELTDFILKNGENKYRATQIFNWLHNKKISDIDKMSNVSKALKDVLKKNFSIDVPIIYKEYVSKIDETKKYLIKLYDGYIIESVLMKYKFGYTICISSEVGCAMGCKFCASTINGLERNLYTNELLWQIYLIENINNIHISNIVIMGSGEPLLNFNNIIDFFNIINDRNGLNISLRNITISTCGIVENIYKLSEYNLPITLALSLHAPNDDIRKKIMPIAYKYKIKDVLTAMADYFNKTNRRITFEYSLIKDINDSVSNANELVDLFNDSFNGKHIDFNVNIIPVNEVKECSFYRPNKASIDKFYNILMKKGINVTIRRELGSDISGSCGQLRAGIKD